MSNFELDIDAILAADTDEEDENLPELGRSIEEILDDAWDDSDDEGGTEVTKLDTPVLFQTADSDLNALRNEALALPRALSGIATSTSGRNNEAGSKKGGASPMYSISPKSITSSIETSASHAALTARLGRKKPTIEFIPTSDPGKSRRRGKKPGDAFAAAAAKVPVRQSRLPIAVQGGASKNGEKVEILGIKVNGNKAHIMVENGEKEENRGYFATATVQSVAVEMATQVDAPLENVPSYVVGQKENETAEAKELVPKELSPDQAVTTLNNVEEAAILKSERNISGGVANQRVKPVSTETANIASSSLRASEDNLNDSEAIEILNELEFLSSEKESLEDVKIQPQEPVLADTANLEPSTPSFPEDNLNDFVDLEGWNEVVANFLSRTAHEDQALGKSGKETKEKAVLVEEKTRLDEAEEFEEREATSASVWEEGISNQPMRLAGIQKGPPAIGLLSLEHENPVSDFISNAATKRDLGSALCLSAHLRFVAVGFSRGSILVAPNKAGLPVDSQENKNVVLSPAASHGTVCSLDFDPSGDLLLAGYSSGAVILWDLTKMAMARLLPNEHSSPIVHIKFLSQEINSPRPVKGITADSKGVVLLHIFNMVPIIRRFTVTTQCLLDGSRGGSVLAIATEPLPTSSSPSPAGGAASPGIGTMMGIRVDAGKKLVLGEGASGEEFSGAVAIVTSSMALIVRFTQSLEIIARLGRPTKSGALSAPGESSLPYFAFQQSNKIRFRSSRNDLLSLSKPTRSFEDLPSQESPSAQTPEPARKAENGKVEDIDCVKEEEKILGCVWDRRVQIHRVSKGETKTLLEFEAETACRGIAWVSEEMFLVFDSEGQITLFRTDGSEIERLRFSHSSHSDVSGPLVFHSLFSTPAGATLSLAFHNSVSISRAEDSATVFCLGSNRLYTARLMSWNERIRALQDAGDWMGAFRMAVDLHEGSTLGVTGLTQDLQQSRASIAHTLLDLLQAYIDEAFAYVRLSEDGLEGATEEYVGIGGVCVEFLVRIGKTDVLFGTVYARFQGVGQKGIFLELLEPYILKDMLPGLPPEVMQSFVEHYGSHGWLLRVEQCILHMDMASLDFDQVVRLCREHCLYSALIRLFSFGLDDFLTPCEELLAVAGDHSHSNASKFGYKLLVYLKYTFRGLYFPPGNGSIPADEVTALTKQILRFILTKPESSKSLKYTSDYPRLELLLSLDTTDTLKVLTWAFNRFEPNSEEDVLGFFVKALIELTLRWQSDGFGMGSGAGSRVAEFVAGFVASGHVSVDRKAMSWVLETLARAEERWNLKTREDLILSVLSSVPDSQWEAAAVLAQSGKAKFWRVCSYLSEKKGPQFWAEALDQCLLDTWQPEYVFEFLKRTLRHTAISRDETLQFRQAVLKKVPLLVQINSDLTLELVNAHFPENRPQVLLELSGDPETQFSFLKSLYRSQDKSPATSSSPGLLDLHQRSKLTLSSDLVELYLKLMCRFEPDSVLPFLQSHGSSPAAQLPGNQATSPGMDLETCLALCLSHGHRLNHAASFLLERMGRLRQALDLYLDNLDRCVEEVDFAVARAGLEVPGDLSMDRVRALPAVSSLKSALQKTIHFCLRNSSQVEGHDRHRIWLPLLDRFMAPIRQLSAARSARLQARRNSESSAGLAAQWQCSRSRATFLAGKALLSDLLVEVLESPMADSVPLTTVLSQMLSANWQASLADYLPGLATLFNKIKFEASLQSNVRRLVEGDAFALALSAQLARTRAVRAPPSQQCALCGRQLALARGDLPALLPCGHGLHSQCLLRAAGREKNTACPACGAGVSTERSEKPQENPTVAGAGGPGASDRKGVEEASRKEQASRFEVFQRLRDSSSPPYSETLYTGSLSLAPPHGPSRAELAAMAAPQTSQEAQPVPGMQPSPSPYKKLSFQDRYKAAMGLFGVAGYGGSSSRKGKASSSLENNLL